MIGTIESAEFIQAGDDDERGPGTYLTIRLDADYPIAAGRVSVTYLDN